MINYIIGTVTSIKVNSIIIETNSIGYEVKTGISSGYELNSVIKLYIYLSVKEDAFELYGFKTSNERDLFLKLISVKGIGPKSAISIVASGKIDAVIKAINDQNPKVLQSFPGIGAKASQQIILDLHGKINFNDQVEKQDPKLNDIIEALKSLGYLNQEIKAINPILLENIEKPISEILKIALKNLAK